MKPAANTVQQVNRALDGISNALLTFRKLDTVAEDILNITYGTGITPKIVSVSEYMKQEARYCILLEYLSQLSKEMTTIESDISNLLVELKNNQKTA